CRLVNGSLGQDGVGHNALGADNASGGQGLIQNILLYRPQHIGALRMMQVIGDSPMPQVMTRDTQVQQSGGELPVFWSPAIEALVIAIDLQRMFAPERLIAALHA